MQSDPKSHRTDANFFLPYLFKSFGWVKNIKVTWNRNINKVQPPLRQPLQRPFTNSIIYYKTWDAVHRSRIEETTLIVGGINIKIRTYNYSNLPTLFPWPKFSWIASLVLSYCYQSPVWLIAKVSTYRTKERKTSNTSAYLPPLI